MRLHDAIRVSEHRAAMLLEKDQPWIQVIVQYDREHYVNEVMCFNADGEWDYVIANWRKRNKQQLQLMLGNEYYNSNQWKPFEEPLAQDMKSHFKRIRQLRRNRQQSKKRLHGPSDIPTTKESPPDDWSTLFT